MKLLILSDLHLEFAPFSPPPIDVDVVILAGDIAPGAAGVRWVAAAFPATPVVYVAGNHEAYGSSVQGALVSMRQACPATVHILENQAVTIGAVRFLGCTLWTDYTLCGPTTQLAAMAKAAQSLSDHRLIQIDDQDGQRPFLPQDALAIHAHSRQWLVEELAKPCAGPTVVVTHHAPHRGSLAPRYAADPLSAAFVSVLGPLMGRAALWVHGHTHTSSDYLVNGTRVVCNPRGYPIRAGKFENAAFNPAMVISV